MSSQEEQYRILKDWDFEEIWGVARAYGRRLRELSIYTAWDLRNADARLIRKRFGVVGERIARELQGVSCLDLEQAVQHSFAWIGNFRWFSKDYEITPSSAKTLIQLAFTRIILKRII